MGLPSMTPAIGILDDCDCPEAKMLVVVFGNPAFPSVEYVNPNNRPLGLRRRWSHFPSLFTPLSEFGVSARFTDDGALEVRRIGESKAHYPDGKPRRWQDTDTSSIDIRLQVAGPVIKAVRAMREAIKEPT